MAQKVDSQKLTQLAGQPVEITVNDGENLEQAEARVMQEHPDMFGGGMGDELAQDAPAGPLPPQLQAMAERAASSGDKKAMAQVQAAIRLYKETLPKPEKKNAPPSMLAGSADIKKYINDLVAANEANRVIGNVEKAKVGVNTGPWAAKVFDATVPQYDNEGNLKSPDFVDSVISTVAPNKTKNIRMLDAAVQGFSDYAFEKGGKSLTGSEKTSIFNQRPNIYDDDNVFTDVLNKSKGDLGSFISGRVNTLKGLGYKEEDILKLLSTQASPGTDTSFLKSKIAPQAQAQAAPMGGLIDPNSLDAELKRRGMK